MSNQAAAPAAAQTRGGGGEPSQASPSSSNSASLVDDAVASTAALAEMEKANALMLAIEADGLTQPQAALRILTEGVDSLKSAVTNHIPMYFSECSETEAEQILRCVCSTTAEDHDRVQVAFAECVRQVVDVVQANWPALLGALFADVGEAACRMQSMSSIEPWAVALRAWIAALDGDAQQHDLVQPWTRRKLNSAAPVDRIVGCEAAIAVVERQGTPAVDALWQDITDLVHDPTPAVAIAVVRTLAVMRKYAGVAMVRICFFPRVLELSASVHDSVAIAAINELIDLAQALYQPRSPPQTPPMKPPPSPFDEWRDLMGFIVGFLTWDPPFPIAVAIATRFGFIIHDTGFLTFTTPSGTATPGGGSGPLTKGDDIAMGYLQRTVAGADVALRHRIAYNFPGIVAALKRDATDRVGAAVGLFIALCGDPHDAVRLQAAAGFSAVARLCGDFRPLTPSSTPGASPLAGTGAGITQQLQEPFRRLLADDNLVIRDRILTNCRDIMGSVFGFDQSRSQQTSSSLRNAVESIFTSMADYAGTVCADWRKVQLVLDLIDSMLGVVAPTNLHQVYVPLLVQHLAGGAAALKATCARLLARVMFATLQLDNRQLLSVSLARVLRLATSPTCFQRAAFNTCVEAFVDGGFSRIFVRTFFLAPAEANAKDPLSLVSTGAAAVVKKINAMPPPVAPPAAEGPLSSAAAPVPEPRDAFLCSRANTERVTAAVKRLESQASRSPGAAGVASASGGAAASSSNTALTDRSAVSGR